jgi:uncharacterized membrane protein
MVDRTDHSTDPADHTVIPGDVVDARESREPREQLAEAFLPTVAVTVTAAVVLSMVLGTGLTTVIAVVGYLLLVPLAAFLQEPLVTMLRDDDDSVDEQQAALDRLRDRYASGEIDELEFERRLERLLETETVEDAAAKPGRDTDRTRATGAERGETTREAEET